MPAGNQHTKVFRDLKVTSIGEAQMVFLMVVSPRMLMTKKQMKFNSFYFNTLNELNGPQRTACLAKGYINVL